MPQTASEGLHAVTLCAEGGIPEEHYSAGLASLLALLLHNDHEQRPSCKALLKHPYVLKHIEYTMHKVRSPRMTPWHACGKSASGKWFL